MQMPEPSEAHTKLEKLAGRWVGEETLHPSPWMPEGGTAQATFSYELGLDGFFLIGDYEQIRDGEVTFRGHLVIGWDAKKQQYAQHWFDSMGMDPGPPAYGTWEGDTLSFQHETPMGHARYVTTFVDGGYTFTIGNSQDGENWQTFMDATFKPA